MPWGCFQRRPMTPMEALTLSPWKKWRNHGRFPWKFTIHVLLAVATTINVVLVANETTPYTRASQETWFSIFFPERFHFSGRFDDSYSIFTVEECKEILARAVDTYYTLRDESVDRFTYYYTPDGAVERPEMVITSYKQREEIFEYESHYSRSTFTTTQLLNETAPLGPLGTMTAAQEREFFDILQSFSVRFHLSNVDLGRYAPVHYKWRVRLVFNSNVRGGQIQLQLDASKKIEDKGGSLLYRPLFNFIWLNATIFALSVVSQFLAFKKLANSFSIYQEIKRSIGPRGSTTISWEDLPFRDKLRFFNLWFIVSVASSVCNIVATTVSIIQDLGNADYGLTAPLFTGLGCFFAWVNLVRYLEYYDKYYTLIRTLKRGMPSVLRFVIGSLPIFVGYALFGVAFFSPFSYKFSDLGQSSVTLFAILNGDIILETFQDLYASNHFLSRLYLYTFISLFIYAVLNIFISIIEEAYYDAKGAQNVKNKAGNLDAGSSDLNLDLDLSQGDSGGGSTPPAAGGTGTGTGAGAGTGMGGADASVASAVPDRMNPVRRVDSSADMDVLMQREGSARAGGGGGGARGVTWSVQNEVSQALRESQQRFMAELRDETAKLVRALRESATQGATAAP